MDSKALVAGVVRFDRLQGVESRVNVSIYGNNKGSIASRE